MLIYLHNYPNASFINYASDMTLHTKYDVSYNTEPEARSCAGGTFFLGAHNSDFVNAPVEATSVRIDAVCASAAVAKYAPLFINACKACFLR